MIVDNLHEVVEGLQELRREEGVVWSVDVSGWASTPTALNIEIEREADGEDVTADFTTTATPTTNGDQVVLPEITVPANAAAGVYRVTFPFEAGGFSPGRPFVRFVVKA